MKKLSIGFRLVFVVVCAVGFVQCSKPRMVMPLRVGSIPTGPDYADSSQWYIAHRNADADVFYLVSTEVDDYQLSDGQWCHFADTHNDSIRRYLLGEMSGVDALLSGGLNYYSPYYRQCTMQAFTNDSFTAERMPLAMSDVRKAFRYYIDHLNGGRPFILAGFSQGAMHMLQLLKEMDDEVFQRMIAAYCIGFVIQPSDLEATTHIRPAQGADDTGVTICYNSVKDPQSYNLFGRYGRSACAINPVNWCTDETPALLITEPSPSRQIDKQSKDTLTVHLDTTTNLLFVSGYTGTDYIIPLIGKEGNYHSMEIWFYRNQLRDNIVLRSKAFQGKF